ncbi:MAG: hypothetical protein ABEN55_23825 [Bradymonadaceae bacterium]
MKVIANWEDDAKTKELLHESGKRQDHARWEYRVDGEVRMYGEGTPSKARQAISTRRKLQY